jgi:hypothetical protein
MEKLLPQPTPAGDPKAITVLIQQLEKEITNAQENSNFLFQKISKLSGFTLACDQEKSEVQDESNGYLDTINNLVHNLAFINRRNDEILNYLDSLI